MSDTKRKESRTYLPRSTIPMRMTVAIDQVAKEKDISYGKAVELLILESITYNKKLDALLLDAPWLQ